MIKQTGRFDLYDFLARHRSEIVAEAETIGKDLAVPDELRDRLGSTGANSALPGILRRRCLAAIDEGMSSIQSPKDIGDEIRRLVKSVYGDDYDAVPTNSCESALLVTYDALLTPPKVGPGEPYRSRVVGLVERHAEHHMSYGRPFPPRYKDGFADRGATAGELGLIGRVQYATDCVMVPMSGARYELHGIKMHPTPLLMETDAVETTETIKRAASTHATNLSGFVTLGYDTVGYGYGEKVDSDVPMLQKNIGDLAAQYGVPYITDNAWGLPFIGADPRELGSDAMLYSMDKVGGAPTTGLIIGKEWPMVNIRRAMGVHGERFGTPSAHGKGLHVHADPGKMSMLGLLAALRILKDEPESITAPIDNIFDIVTDEYSRMKGDLPAGIVITKSYNFGGVEVNYERTWRASDGGSKIGIPIFNNEDRVAGSNILSHVTAAMGILPGVTDDANVIINPGLGTSASSGQLIEENMRLVARGMFRAFALMADWASRV